MGRASGSAAAAALTWDFVIRRMGIGAKCVSAPSFDTLTTWPSARILAVVIVFLMPLRPSGRDDPDALVTFRVSHMEQYAVTRPYHMGSCFPVVLASVEAFDGEKVAENLDRLLKSDTVRAPVGCRLVLIPLELQGHITTDFPYPQIFVPCLESPTSFRKAPRPGLRPEAVRWQGSL
jgi:hypothetical protein